jgi:NAD(P)-dependent dehydrogenase (short-subunit alcohol dehydrogenase family)
MKSPPVIIVTGGNRGIGREICRSLAQQAVDAHIILCARDPVKGEAAAAVMHADGLVNVSAHHLDVTDPNSVMSLVHSIKSAHQGVDVLINNAGHAARGEELTEKIARTTLAVNFYGARQVSHALKPLMHDCARVVNVSSGMGELDSSYSNVRREALLHPDLTLKELEEIAADFIDDVIVKRVSRRGWPANAYRVSKATLNALTRIWARDWADDGISVNAVCPGWVRTDMGGISAPRTAAKGAETPAWLALAPLTEIGGSGLFFRDKEKIDW